MERLYFLERVHSNFNYCINLIFHGFFTGILGAVGSQLVKC